MLYTGPSHSFSAKADSASFLKIKKEEHDEHTK